MTRHKRVASHAFSSTFCSSPPPPKFRLLDNDDTLLIPEAYYFTYVFGLEVYLRIDDSHCPTLDDYYTSEGHFKTLLGRDKIVVEDVYGGYFPRVPRHDLLVSSEREYNHQQISLTSLSRLLVWIKETYYTPLIYHATEFWQGRDSSIEETWSYLSHLRVFRQYQMWQLGLMIEYVRWYTEVTALRFDSLQQPSLMKVTDEIDQWYSTLDKHNMLPTMTDTIIPYGEQYLEDWLEELHAAASQNRLPRDSKSVSEKRLKWIHPMF